MVFLKYFFFQAEDGIRDDLVTGVQTCALPILADSYVSFQLAFAVLDPGSSDLVRQKGHIRISQAQHLRPILVACRSEERRVGKECRSRWCGLCLEKDCCEKLLGV